VARHPAARIDDLAASVDALRARTAALGLDALADSIMQVARPAVKLVPGGADDRSFFGAAEGADTLVSPSGRAVQPLLHVYLPQAFAVLEDWPDALAGLAGLPSEGWLAFGAVLDAELEVNEGLPHNDGAAIVAHHDGEDDLTPCGEGFAGAFQVVGLELILTVPDPEIAEQTFGVPPELLDAYTVLWEPQTGTTPGPQPPSHALHYLFGHAGWLYSSGLPSPGEPQLELLAQIAPDDAVGAPRLRDRVVYFTCEQNRPLDTLNVFVQR
jgi:hypothetical protein